MQLTVALYDGDHSKLNKVREDNEARISSMCGKFNTLGALYTVTPGPRRTAAIALGGVLTAVTFVGIAAYATGYATVGKF
jgi:hypothetical protein